ncbi:MAG: imidazole glycerol phosphate synthase subunit HisH [Bacteroidota bacterium]
MNVAIVQYNAGNVQSVIYALERLGITPTLTGDPDQLRAADKVIFPGVGEASTTMDHLRETGVDELLPSLTQPVLGICLGLQLMCRHSEEGNTPCMGIFDVLVKKFVSHRPEEKVPHMGWNQLHQVKGPLFEGIAPEDYVYFVHSFYAEQHPDAIALCNYLHPFSAALQHQNFYALQFHPEKSGDVGARVLRNFVEL